MTTGRREGLRPSTTGGATSGPPEACPPCRGWTPAVVVLRHNRAFRCRGASQTRPPGRGMRCPSEGKAQGMTTGRREGLRPPLQEMPHLPTGADLCVSPGQRNTVRCRGGSKTARRSCAAQLTATSSAQGRAPAQGRRMANPSPLLDYGRAVLERPLQAVRCRRSPRLASAAPQRYHEGHARTSAPLLETVSSREDGPWA